MNITRVENPIPVLLGIAPDTAAVEKLMAAPVVPEGLVDKQGRALAPLCAEVAAAGENPVLILPLAMEDPAFLLAVLEHACGWAAAGAALAAKAAQAAEVVVYTAGEQAGRMLAEAMGNYGMKPRVVTGEGSAVLREESALYSVLDGKALRSELLDKDFPTQGWQGRPTLILDIETACWLAALATGAAEKQGKLMAGVAMASPDAVKLAELAPGTCLDAAVEAFGFTVEKPLLMGGITGFIAPLDQLGTTDVLYTKDFDTLRSFDKSFCMAQVGAQLTSDIEAMSCGKCVLCREGSWQFKAAFAEFPEGKGKKTDFELVPDIGSLIAIGAFCGYGRDMVRVPMGLVQHCREELEAHVVRRQCPAGVCTAFSSYVIDPQLCEGCGDCMDACPEDAIEGKPKFIHMIDDALCTKCGKCAEVCPTGAARLATGRMRLPKKLTRVGRF